MTARPTIGIALGGGAARGWAHIGVLEALRERGIDPQVVSGASIGALVGAALAGGNLSALKEWVLELRRLDVLKLLSRSRLAGDPPELEIVPDLQDMGLMDFHRAALAVERGVEAVSGRAEEIGRLLSVIPDPTTPVR